MSAGARRGDEVTDLIRRHWDTRARSFDEELGHGVHSEEQRRAWLELLVSVTGSSPLRVLDAGCGTGVLSLLLSDLGHRVTGVDLAEEMLAIARGKATRSGRNVELRLENVTKLSDSDSTYDLVIARHVIWTLPDPVKGAREWLRVLKPGGRLALIEGKWGRVDGGASDSKSIRWAIESSLDALLALASYLRGRKRTRFYMRKYRRVEADLPFSGGPPAERLLQFLREHGFVDLSAQPLMSAALWGEVPEFPRYLAIGRRP